MDTIERLERITTELIELAQNGVAEGDDSDDLYTAAAAVDAVTARIRLRD